MFQIGEKIVYPTHGAGVVEQIKQEEIDGEMKQFYIIQLIIQELRIMIPVGKEETLGVRPIVSSETIKTILEKFKTQKTNHTLSSKEHINRIKEKIKTGQFEDILSVVFDLTKNHTEKPLNTAEKQLLNQASAILRSELQLVNGITEQEVFCYS